MKFGVLGISMMMGKMGGPQSMAQLLVGIPEGSAACPSTLYLFLFLGNFHWPTF
jgi:hypothetical protein